VTLEEARRLLSEVRLSGFFDVVQLDVDESAWRLMEQMYEYTRRIPIRVTMMRIPHRDTGEPTRVSMSAEVEVGEAFAQSAFCAVLKMVRHELAECFLHRDERVFDPHAGEAAL
jgi:hypothetical protein